MVLGRAQTLAQPMDHLIGNGGGGHGVQVQEQFHSVIERIGIAINPEDAYTAKVRVHRACEVPCLIVQSLSREHFWRSFKRHKQIIGDNKEI